MSKALKRARDAKRNVAEALATTTAITHRVDPIKVAHGRDDHPLYLDSDDRLFMDDSDSWSCKTEKGAMND